MPCPYAEKKGPVVYCRLTGKKVNPLAFPCLTDRYEKCKYFRMHAKKEEVPVAPTTSRARERSEAAGGRTGEPVKPVSRAVEEAKVRGRPRGETKGLTLDGRRPSSCLECIYYGTKTKTCLLLGVTVEDPNDPPCARM